MSEPICLTTEQEYVEFHPALGGKLKLVVADVVTDGVLAEAMLEQANARKLRDWLTAWLLEAAGDER